MAATQFRTLLRVLNENPENASFKNSQPTRREVIKIIKECEGCPKNTRDRVDQIIEHPKARCWALDECDKEIAALPAAIVAEAKANGDELVEELIDGTTLAVETVSENVDEVVETAVEDEEEEEEEDEDNVVAAGDAGEIAELTATVLKQLLPELLTAIVAAVTDAILPMFKNMRTETEEMVNKELNGLDDFLKRTMPMIEEMVASNKQSTAAGNNGVINSIKNGVGNGGLNGADSVSTGPAPRKRPTLQSIFATI
jgi:hypothetical protein